MELPAHFPFTIPLKFSNIDTPFPLGHFRSSNWSLLVDNRFHVKMIRSKGIGNFAINANISLYNAQSKKLLCKEHWMGSIVEDETSIFITSPLKSNVEGANTLFGEFRGTISILQLQTAITEKIKPSPQPSKHFLRLLSNPPFPDAFLKNGGEGFTVHKGVLSVRSPVVAKMLNQMQESNSSVIDIVETEPNFLQATVKYVYNGKTDYIAGCLLHVADEYRLEELKKVCVDELKSNITVENVFHILALGDLHDMSLKAHAMKFVCMCDKFSNLEKMDEWKTLRAERKGLAIELLSFVVKHLEKISNKSNDTE